MRMYFKDNDIHYSSLVVKILGLGVPAAKVRAAVRLSALHGSLLQSFTQIYFQMKSTNEYPVPARDGNGYPFLQGFFAKKIGVESPAVCSANRI